MNKTTIIILSDPKSGGEEALGRAFNGLATAYDLQQTNQEVEILFQGTGSRWPEHLSTKDHPLNGLYELVKESIKGISSGCADFFGGKDAAQANEIPIIAENLIPGTSGLPSIASLLKKDNSVLTF